jgi:hypothetical protein
VPLLAVLAGIVLVQMDMFAMPSIQTAQPRL